MSYDIEIVGDEGIIAEVRSYLVSVPVEVSEIQPLERDSTQLSTPWSPPEIIDLMKIITAALQTSAALIVVIKHIREYLKENGKVLLERQDNGAQLKLEKTTSDHTIKAFAQKDALKGE